MKEIKLKLYQDNIDKLNPKSKKTKDYKIVVEMISEYPNIIGMPNGLSPDELNRLKSKFLLEHIRLKIIHIDEYMDKKDKSDFYKSVYKTLLYFLDQGYDVIEIDRDTLEKAMVKNRKSNRNYYLEQKRLLESDNSELTKKYISVIKGIYHDGHNLIRASSVLTFDEFNKLLDDYDFTDIKEVFNGLNKFEYTALSKTSLYDFFIEKAEDWGYESASDPRVAYRRFLRKAGENARASYDEAFNAEDDE